MSSTRRALKHKRDARRAETEQLRTGRRRTLSALLSRAKRGVLSSDEAALLCMHVEAELAEGDAARASERGQQRAMERHRQTVQAADAAIRETEQRAEQAEAELAAYREIEEQHRADRVGGMMQRTVDHYRELAKEWEAQCHRVSARLAEQRARASQNERRAEAMERAMESTAADALAHRGCHRDLMAQCQRAEQAELRATLAEGDVRTLRAGLRANGADPTQIQNLWAQIRLRNRQWREAKQRAEQAEEHRAALSEALGLGTSAPWDAIRDRVTEQSDRRMEQLIAGRAMWKAKAAEMEADRDRIDKALREAKEHARKAAVAALNLRSQTPNAAQRTLALVRDARTWGQVWIHLGIYYGMKPEEAGLEARARRTEAERRAETALAEGLAAVDRCEAARDRYRNAWLSARRWARHHKATSKMATARMEHATGQAARQAVELVDARRDARRSHETLKQWEAAYGEHALRHTITRLNAAEYAIARVKALREQTRRIAPFAQGPTWEMLWEAMGDALRAPSWEARAGRCVPGNAELGHPVDALLGALKDGRARTDAEAIDLTRAYYEAIHAACCPLNHREQRPGRAAEANRALLESVGLPVPTGMQP